MEYNQSEFLIETEVPTHEEIISRTDLKGNITFANDIFCKISGYSLEELIGKAHNIVRHPDMPKEIYRELWDTLKSQKQWSGIVKNLRKDKGFYWVKAIVSGVYKDGKLIEYKSLRTPVTYDEKLYYQKLYDKIRKDNGEQTRRVIYE